MEVEEVEMYIILNKDTNLFELIDEHGDIIFITNKYYIVAQHLRDVTIGEC